MHAIDLSVYLVLDPELCGGFQGMIDTALAAAQNGATVVQLRAPKWKKRALAECARELKARLAPLHVPFTQTSAPRSMPTACTLARMI